MTCRQKIYNFGLLVLVSSIVLMFVGCPPRPMTKKPLRKVIVTNLGEVTHNARYVGETNKYKIYYLNNTKRSSTVTIVEKLNASLKDIKVFDGGRYDVTTHSIVWQKDAVSPGTGGHVGFVATLSNRGLTENQATMWLDKKSSLISTQRLTDRGIKSNIVVTSVCGRPDLGWIPFEQRVKEGSPPRAAMKEETTMGTMVRFDIPGVFAREARVKEGIFHRLIVPTKAHRLNLGKPELPIVGQMVEIPKGVNFSLEIVKAKQHALDCYNVIPVQTPIDRKSPGIKSPFIQHRVSYTSNRLYPGELALVEPQDIGIIRGHRVVFLKVNPIQHNPVTRETIGYSSIEVRLEFDRPGQIERVDPRIESEAFEQMLGASIMNYKPIDRFGDRGDRDDEDEKQGCDYLILTDGSFYNASDANNPLNRLAQWKRQKGLITQIEDVANIPGSDSQEKNIQAYLQDAYDNWYPPPTYVLLVGDAEFIAPHYQTVHPTAHNRTDIGTDLYYSTLDGTDYFPDIYLGRLSVDTTGELRDVVNKILDYEQNPPANAAFYEDNSLACLFEDVDGNPSAVPPEDGREDATFRIIEFAEEIFGFLDGPDFDPERIWDESAIRTAPVRYENGSLLPNHLTAAGGFVWNGATADIRNAINNGIFLLTFNGHGLRDGWGRPRFRNANVLGLTNGALTPVVFSLTCQSGWFDNETDAADFDGSAPGNQGTGNNDESFSELFLRQNNAGAVAVIGASRNSWEQNDFMMLGLYKALWPEFDPAPPFGPGLLPDIEAGPLYRIGQVHNFSKVYLANYYSHSNLRAGTFELYHLFGDPEMPIWTNEPPRLNVNHPEGIGATGDQDFVVRVLDGVSNDPLRTATVVLTRGENILAVRQTNPNGFARFNMNSVGAGDLDITVTIHNYRPYQAVITVKGGGAELNRLDPENGITGQVIDVGGQRFSGSEEIDLVFDDETPVRIAASGGRFGQIGADAVNLTVPASQGLGPVNILAEGRNSGRYAVDVFQVRSANPIDLYIYDQWDSSTWHLNPGDNPVWNNPDIQLYDSTGAQVQSNNLVAGNTYTVKAKIHNDTDFDANQVEVVFKWANFGLGQEERDWTEIDVDKKDVPAHDSREAEVNWAPSSTGHLCILATIYHIEDINEDNNKGQENCHVGPTSSPAKVSFLVGNPTKEAGYVNLELRQVSATGSQNKLLWESRIEQPDPQWLLPGEKRKAWVIIDPAKVDIRPDESAEFALTGFMGRQMIGGANFIIIKR